MAEADLESIPERLIAARARVAAAAERAGRAARDVLLLAVSKGKPPEAIRAAYAAGQRDFGENYVQELVHKADVLRDLDGIVWHFIGQLQRNKARDVARVAAFIHAVDREELAIELDRRAAAAGRRPRVLIEVNVAGEASKAGAAPDEVERLVRAVQTCHSLELVGLMTIPPATDDPEQVRPFFAALRALRDRAAGAAGPLPHLSMGMSGDFEVAIAEGATIVRIGTAIFGARGAAPQ